MSVVVDRYDGAMDQASPRLLDRVRAAVRVRHLSRRTEKAYVGWIRRFILFHGKRHPDELGPAEMSAFLSALATRNQVSSSTQNQALAALLFLYRVVLEREVPWLNDVVRAKRPGRLPVVMSREEVANVLTALGDDRRLAAMLRPFRRRVNSNVSRLRERSTWQM